MSFYPVSSRPAISGVEIPGGDQAAAQAVMVAVPVSALVWPVRAGSGRDGRSALLVEGAEPVTAGGPVAWCKVVVVAPVVLRRDGRVQAEGRPCDHARLGVAEQELDRRCGPETIERIAAGVCPTGKIKAVARREMSVACTIRAVLLMTVMPDADSREVLTTLLGELTEVPWRRAHAVPSGTVLSTWRAAVGEAPLQQLQREVLAAVGAEHRDPALPRVDVGGGLRLGAIDGTVTWMPDTAPNRAAFGTAGAAETGYPQIRHLHVSDALTRATLGVVCGPAGGDKAGTKGEAEQALLDRMLVEQPDVFTPDRLWIMDRNFPGVARIAAMLATGTHVLIRVKSDIRLPRIGGYVIQHRVPGERMPEPDITRLQDQQLQISTTPQRAHHRVLADPDNRAEQVNIEPATEQRGSPEHRPLRVGQEAKTAGDRPAHRDRDRRTTSGHVGPAIVDTLQCAAVGRCGKHLFYKQREPVGHPQKII